MLNIVFFCITAGAADHWRLVSPPQSRRASYAYEWWLLMPFKFNCDQGFAPTNSWELGFIPLKLAGIWVL